MSPEDVTRESGFGAPRDDTSLRARLEKMQHERDEARVQLEQAKALLGPMRVELGHLRGKNEQMRTVLRNLRGVVIMNEHRRMIDKCLGR
jgi:hypothetical protein